MIKVTGNISIAENELSEEFIRATGPGGQNVNKTETAVQLRFQAMESPNLPAHVKERLKAIAGNSMTREGEIIVVSRKTRSQETNRADALEKLLGLIRAATVVPKKRRKTRPTVSSREKRLKGKTIRSKVKKMRRKGGED